MCVRVCACACVCAYVYKCMYLNDLMIKLSDAKRNKHRKY